MAFDNIKLEKGLYTTGKSFTAALEELDPSSNYVGTPLEGLDAYERQLKRFDIKVSGKSSDNVSKFFATTDSAALFPEYIARAVKTGIESNSIVDELVATTTEIDSMDYRSIKTANSADDIELEEVNEGAAIPELTIALSDDLTELQKHGKMIVASYEAIKFQKLDLFTTVLKQIGDHIARSEFEQAIAGFDDTKSTVITTQGNTFTYADLVKLWVELSPYNFNRMVVSPKTLGQLLLLPEFMDANAGFDFQSSGNIITPFGAKVLVSNTIADDMILALDKDYAIEKVQAGGIVTEFDKLIDRQLERATVSTITGFSTIYDDAIVGLKLKA